MEQILKEIPTFFEDEQVQDWCSRSNQNLDTGYFSQVGSGSVPDVNVKGILPEFQIEYHPQKVIIFGQDIQSYVQVCTIYSF